MALIAACGFETGISAELQSTYGTFSIQTAIKHTAGYALRCNPSFGVSGYGEFVGNAANGARTPFSASTAYFCGYIYLEAIPSAEDRFFRCLTSGGLTKAYGTITATGAVKLYDSAGTLAGTSSATLTADQWHLIQIKIGSSATVGAIELKINGNTEISTTGNTNVNPSAYCGLGSPVIVNSNNYDCYFDDWVVENAAYIDPIVAVGTPSGNGTYTDFSGSYLTVDELPWGTADSSDSSSAGTAETYTVTVTPSLSGTIHAVIAKAYAQELTGGGTENFAVRLRSGSTNSDTSGTTLSATATVYSKILTTDPATGTAWTTSAAAAVEVGGIDIAGAANRVKLHAAQVQIVYTPAAGGPTVIDLTSASFGLSAQSTQNNFTNSLLSAVFNTSAQQVQSNLTANLLAAELKQQTNSINLSFLNYLASASLSFAANSINLLKTTVIDLSAASFGFVANAITATTAGDAVFKLIRRGRTRFKTWFD